MMETISFGTGVVSTVSGRFARFAVRSCEAECLCHLAEAMTLPRVLDP